MTLATASVWLFVPGDRPDRFDRAGSSGANVAIVDLEDAVAPDRRSVARVAVVEALARGARIAVRVSSPSTADGSADLDALATCANRPLAIVVAKAEGVAELERVGALGVPLVPLVESAAGLLAAPTLARYPGTVRLAFGAVDFSLDVGCSPDPDVLGPV
ncbi:MAG: aldolase/citrate lyase family protein, partial [Rhodoglobus sp.]|nr:aldolase/citrate lyase family protein [Rhodoglobus sp.]